LKQKKERKRKRSHLVGDYAGEEALGVGRSGGGESDALLLVAGTCC